MSSIRRPKLSTFVLNDDEQLAQIIESHIQTYCRHADLQFQILRLQSTLRDLVDEKAWTVFLEVEDADIYRNNRIRESLVRWAFRTGARSRKRR